MKEYDDLIKHGNIQIVDYVRNNGWICDGCTEEATFTIMIGEKEFYLCSECLNNLGHCVIDGLL